MPDDNPQGGDILQWRPYRVWLKADWYTPTGTLHTAMETAWTAYTAANATASATKTLAEEIAYRNYLAGSTDNAEYKLDIAAAMDSYIDAIAPTQAAYLAAKEAYEASTEAGSTTLSPWIAAPTLLGADWLAVQAVSSTIAPTIPRADLVWRYGDVRTEQETEATVKPPVSLIGYFIKIDAADPVPTDGSAQTWTTIFVGTIAADSRDIHGCGSGMNAKGDQIVTAFGLEYLLDREVIRTAWATNDGSAEIEIDYVPAFNERYVVGLSRVGNRSYTQPPHGDHSSFVFGGTTSGGYVGDNVWTHENIATYLVTHYQPRGIYFALAGESESLTMVEPAVHLVGMTVREAMSRLISHRRGFGWRVNVLDDDTVQIYVFTLTGADIGEDPLIIPANTDTVAIDNGRIDIDSLVTMNADLTQYGAVRVEGERIKVQFTVSYNLGNLEKAWSASDEADYIAPGTGTVEKDNQARTENRFGYVYQGHRIPDTWNWTSGSADANVAITFGPDGTFIPTVQGNVRRWGGAHQILGKLLTPKPFQTSTLRESLEEPFAFIPAAFGGTGYWQLDKIPANTGGAPGASFRKMECDFGFQLETNPNHAFGLNHYTGDMAAANSNVYDYEDIGATIAVELDERLKIELQLANDSTAVLVIPVKDAEFWWVVPGTVLGIVGGALVTQAGDGSDDSTALRDDRDRLREIANAAAAWYTPRRASIVAKFRQICTDYYCGQYVTAVVDTNDLTHTIPWQDVGTVISSITWDFENGTTDIRTHYAELDFTNLR